MLQTFQHIARSQMQQSDKDKSKKVIRLWKSGKIYPDDSLSELEKIMERSAPSTEQPAQPVTSFEFFSFSLTFSIVGCTRSEISMVGPWTGAKK